MKRYWDTIETPFGTFAAWVDEAGRLLRFKFRISGAAKVDPEAERDTRALSGVRATSVGRIASCASCAFFALLTYSRGAAGR